MQQNVWGFKKRKKEKRKIRKVQYVIVYCRCKRVLLILVETCKSAMQGQPHCFAKHISAFVQSCIERKWSQAASAAWSQEGMSMTVLFMDSCQCACRVLIHTETLLTSISMSTGLFASLQCKCWHVLRFKEWVIRDSRCKALRACKILGGICKYCKMIFFLLHFKCIVTKEK